MVGHLVVGAGKDPSGYTLWRAVTGDGGGGATLRLFAAHCAL